MDHCEHTTQLERVAGRPRLDLGIRWMIRSDLSGVLEIERESFPDPWTEAEFIQFMRQRNSIGMVAEHKEHVVGYMLYELHKTKLTIHNFAVSPWWRRAGIGHAMLAKLKGKLSVQRRTRLALRVRETNLDGQLFFRSQGFRVVNTAAEPFDDCSENAYLMTYRHKWNP